MQKKLFSTAIPLPITQVYRIRNICFSQNAPQYNSWHSENSSSNPWQNNNLEIFNLESKLPILLEFFDNTSTKKRVYTLWTRRFIIYLTRQSVDTWLWFFCLFQFLDLFLLSCFEAYIWNHQRNANDGIKFSWLYKKKTRAFLALTRPRRLLTSAFLRCAYLYIYFRNIYTVQYNVEEKKKCLERKIRYRDI